MEGMIGRKIHVKERNDRFSEVVERKEMSERRKKDKEKI